MASIPKIGERRVPPPIYKYLRPGRVLLGKYKIIKPLAEGGFGVVFKGVNINTGRPVAIKAVQDPRNIKSVQDLAAEITVLRSLPNFPGLPALLAADGKNNDYFVMELIEGITFHDFITAQRPAHLNRLLNIIRSVIHNLLFLHEYKQIHIDVKPANLMLAEGDRVIIIDIGLGAIFQKALQTGQVRMGHTEEYSSPEQMEIVGLLKTRGKDSNKNHEIALQKAQRIDGRSDIYSVGKILEEMLTNLPLFEAAKLSRDDVAWLHDIVDKMKNTANLRGGCYTALFEIDRFMEARQSLLENTDESSARTILSASTPLAADNNKTNKGAMSQN